MRSLIAFIFILNITTVNICIGQENTQSSINVNYGEISLQEFIEKTKAEFNIHYKYKKEWINSKKVDVADKFNSKEEMVKSVLDKFGFSVIFRDPYYAILLKNGLDIPTIGNEKSNTKEVISLGQVQIGLKEAVLNGVVKSGENDAVIPGVSVIVKESGMTTSTDVNGQFRLKLDPGYHTLYFNSLETTDMELPILLNSDSKINIELFKDYKQLSEVVVTAKAPDENIKSTVGGTQRVTIEEIKKLPAFLGEADVIKSITSLPGVNVAGDAGGGFNVRGSGVGANLVLLDEGIVFNTSHLFGLFTAFSAEAVSSAELYKGAVPASFGGRAASILDVDISSANKYKFTTKGRLGFVSSGINLQIPIIKSKSSLLANFRSAYPNYILNRIENDNLTNSKAFFGDATLKYDHIINDKNNIQFTGYLSGDTFSVDSTLSYDYSNYVGSINWNHSIRNNFNFNLAYSFNLFNSLLSDNEDKDLSYNLFNELQDNRLKLNFNYDVLQNHQINFGTEVNHYQFNPGEFKNNESSNLDTENVEPESAVEAAFFVGDDYKINDFLSVYGGMRFSVFDGGKEGLQQTYTGFEPRFSLNYILNKRNSIKLGFGRMMQYIHLISNTAAITPIDIWKLSNQRIRPTSSMQLSLGYFKNFNSNDIETSIETFYKVTDQLIEYKNGAQLFANNNLEDELLQGEGLAYGAEIYVKKNNGLLTGFLSYTYSRSFITVDGEEQDTRINNGNPFPTNFDQPHNLTVLANYKFSRIFDVSANFTYNTGRAITYPNTRYRYYGIWVANYTDRNSERISDYHRLDLSFNISPSLKKNKKYEASWTFTLYNVYSRKNAYSIYFKPSNAYNQLDGYKLSIIGQIIPAITYNFKF